MASSDNSPKQHQQEAVEILRDLLTNEDNLKPAKHTTEVRQLFVGNLPFRAKWQDMKDLFRKAGQVIRADVALSPEGRSKGHGTVLFATVQDAQKAIDTYNGYKWLGRALEVRADRGYVDSEKNATQEEVVINKEDVIPEQKQEIEKVEPPSPKKTIKSPTQKEAEVVEDDCKQIFVGNLPFQCQWQDLRNLFKSEGRVIRADVVVNFEGRSRGFGTVLYSSHEHAKKAIEKYDGFEFHNRILRVHFDKFAANHQRLREHEADTFGQRQIHDPVSLEQLRQTYLPQQTVNYNHLMAPYIHQTPPYIENMMDPTTATTMPPSTNANTLYNSNNYYYNATPVYNNNYDSQPSYYPPVTTSTVYGNNSALYPTTDDRVLHTMANLTLSDNSQPWMHPQQPTSVPYHLPPLMQYQYLPNGQDNLSNSLEELHLPTTNDSSAGLNNYHGGYMQP